MLLHLLTKFKIFTENSYQFSGSYFWKGGTYMYPLLKWNVVLVKQYEKSYIYNLSRKENGIIVSSHFMYEIINKDATYILELCNGARKIEDIVKILSEKIKQKSEDIETIVDEFLQESVKKGYIEFREKPNIQKIKVLGDSESYTPFHAEFEITKKCPLKMFTLL